MRNERVESSLARESSDMQLIKNIIAQRNAMPPAILPRELRTDNFGWAMDALRLEARCRIGALGAAVESIKIALARSHVFNDGCEITVAIRFELNRALTRRNNVQF